MSFPELPKARTPSIERVLKDYENPFSLVNIVPTEFRRVIENLPDDFINLTEEELENKFPNPQATILQLRKMFWLEYDRAVECRTKMDFSRIYLGVCTKEIFLKILRTPSNLAWLLCPPVDYTNQVEELLTFSLKQVREILAMPLKNNLGFVDSKLADTKLRAAMMLDLRLKGGYVQRSVQLTHNVNETTTKHISNTVVSGELPIDDRIKQLEQELEKAKLSLPPPAPQFQMNQKNTVEKVVIDADFTEITPDKKGSSEGVSSP